MNDFIEKLKYGEEIASLISTGACHPTQFYEPVNKEAYRFVFRNELDKNHIPVYKQNPSRILNGKSNTSGYALSCFCSKECAEKKYSELLSLYPFIFKSIGDHLSTGILENGDGRITSDTPSGHFDLYEFVDCDLNKKFEILYSLVG
jgi:hypothetical protein